MYKIVCEKAQKMIQEVKQTQWSIFKCITSCLLTWNKNDKYLWRLPLILLNLSTGKEKHEFNNGKWSLKIVWEHCCIIWTAREKLYKTISKPKKNEYRIFLHENSNIQWEITRRKLFIHTPVSRRTKSKKSS